MTRLNRFSSLLAVMVGLAACAAPTTPESIGPGTGASPSGSPSSQPSTQPSAGNSAAPAQSSRPGATTYLRGTIFDEAGRPIENAYLRYRDETAKEETWRETAPASGRYLLTDVPVGHVFRLVAVAPDYAERERSVLTARSEDEDDDERKTGTLLDYGGPDAGDRFYALSRYSDISRPPGASAQAVPQGPLELQLRFSPPLPKDERARFNAAWRLRFPSQSGEAMLRLESVYAEQGVSVEWAEDGTMATLVVPFPLVFLPGTSRVVRLDLDPNLPLASLPKNAGGYVLGRGKEMTAYDFGDGKQRVSVAPFVRTPLPSPLPSASFVPDDLWGYTHRTELGVEVGSPSQSFKLEAIRPMNSATESLLRVKFNQPLRGFPEENLSKDNLVASNFGLWLGTKEDDDFEEKYRKADPKTSSISILEVRPDPTDPAAVLLVLPKGAFASRSHYKFYASERLRDVWGNALDTQADAALLTGTL